MTKIKICGNTRAEDVELAVELGADLLGFIFTNSKRQVRVDEITDVIARVPGLATDPDGMETSAYCGARLVEHYAYVRANGDDMPDVRDWRWPVNIFRHELTRPERASARAGRHGFESDDSVK